MVTEMPKLFYQYNAQILPPVWQLLTQTAEIYVKVVVNANDTDQDDDEMSNFTTLIMQLFEFIHSIVEQSRFKTIVQTVLIDLAYISILFIQITEDQIEEWNDDIESFVDDLNAVECSNGTIRLSSRDLLTTISEDFGADVMLPAMAEAFKRHVHVAESEKLSNNQNWWKIIEASITAIGSLSKQFNDATDDTKNKFKIREYLAYTKTTLGQGGNGSGYQGDISPYLHGKCLWTLCRYANALPDIYDRPTLQAVLDCVANDFNGAKPMVVQICAMRSLSEVCEELKSASDEQRQMVVDKLSGFLNFITDIAARAKGNALSEILCTIARAAAVSLNNIFNEFSSFMLLHFCFDFQFDKNFTANNHSRVITFTTAIFVKYFDDPFVLEQVQDIINSLAVNEFCIGALHERLVPTLVSILNLENNANVEQKHLMQDTTMEILQTIVKHSPIPLSPILVNDAFPATVKCILNTEDSAIMQSGGECLRTFISGAYYYYFL